VCASRSVPGRRGEAGQHIRHRTRGACRPPTRRLRGCDRLGRRGPGAAAGALQAASRRGLRAGPLAHPAARNSFLVPSGKPHTAVRSRRRPDRRQGPDPV
ncbi:MAG: hypothetical protein AVDCRST_MAG36-2321, partial [uncultured Nocardioidaceae bacterium]